jgi:hypothetical protein
MTGQKGKYKSRKHMHPQAKAEKLLIEMKMMVTHFPRFGHMRRPINTPVKKN